jgi:hypothetical protein
MTVKKVLLLTSMALVAIATTAPAMAQAEGYWWYDGEEEYYPTPGLEKEVKPFGELSLTVNGIEFGPCEKIELRGELWNELMGMGEGEVLESLQNGKKCKTSLPGCTVEESTLLGFPWLVTLKAEKKVLVSGIEVETHLSEKCNELYGLPLTSTAFGSAEGDFVDYDEEEGLPAAIEFNESSGLVLEGFQASLDGSLRFGTKLEAEFTP